MTYGFEYRKHWARRHTSQVLCALVFILRDRTPAPHPRIFSAKSKMPVSETTSFSKRVRSIPEMTRESIISAPAGPRVVITCMILVMLRFKLVSGTHHADAVRLPPSDGESD